MPVNIGFSMSESLADSNGNEITAGLAVIVSEVSAWSYLVLRYHTPSERSKRFTLRSRFDRGIKPNVTRPL